MRHVSLVTKMCLALCLAQVPLVGMLLAVTLTTRASIAEHSQALLQATQVKGLAATSLALLLTQQDVQIDVVESGKHRRSATENPSA